MVNEVTDNDSAANERVRFGVSKGTSCDICSVHEYSCTREIIRRTICKTLISTCEIVAIDPDEAAARLRRSMQIVVERNLKASS